MQVKKFDSSRVLLYYPGSRNISHRRKEMFVCTCILELPEHWDDLYLTQTGKELESESVSTLRKRGMSFPGRPHTGESVEFDVVFGPIEATVKEVVFHFGEICTASEAMTVLEVEDSINGEHICAVLDHLKSVGWQ